MYTFFEIGVATLKLERPTFIKVGKEPDPAGCFKIPRYSIPTITAVHLNIFNLNFKEFLFF